MEIINFKNSLLKVCKVADLTKAILDQLKEKNLNLNELRFDLELTTYICNVVENEISHAEKEEKIKIIINIVSQLYVLSDADKSIIQSQIEYLVNNKKIKKIKTSKWLWRSSKNWFFKKFA